MLLFMYYFFPEFVALKLCNKKMQEEVNINILEKYFTNLCVFFHRNDIEEQIIFEKNHYNEIYFEYKLSDKKYGFISYLKPDRIIIESDNEAIRFELNKFDCSDWQNILQKQLYERFDDKKSTY